ncbi:MAG: hypothetical protein JST01_03670 [Cyanobacteria bacterium SZAS TMP-1]|nr:hypothetical protein [Cyanobacteria bacterium SZAS TMP-1]
MISRNKKIALVFLASYALVTASTRPVMAVFVSLPPISQPPSGPFPRAPWTPPVVERNPDATKSGEENPSDGAKESPKEQPRPAQPAPQPQPAPVPSPQPQPQPQPAPGQPVPQPAPGQPNPQPGPQPQPIPKPVPQPGRPPAPAPTPDPAPRSHERPWIDQKPDFPL